MRRCEDIRQAMGVERQAEMPGAHLLGALRPRRASPACRRSMFGCLGIRRQRYRREGLEESDDKERGFLIRKLRATADTVISCALNKTIG